MKQIALLLTLISFSIGQKTFACDCDVKDGFVEAASKTDFVALVKVTKYLALKNIYGEQKPISMEVEVVEVYKGRERRKKFTVWGGDVEKCRPMLSKFKEGGLYVIAFNQALDGSNDKNAHPGEKTSDYAISICGEYWLTADMNNKTGRGWINEENDIFELKDLKAILNTKQE